MVPVQTAKVEVGAEAERHIGKKMCFQMVK